MMMIGMQTRNAQKRAVPRLLTIKPAPPAPPRPREVTDRHPKKVATPHPPQRLTDFERTRSRTETRVDQILHHAHQTEPNDRYRRSLRKQRGRSAKRVLQSMTRNEYRACQCSTTERNRACFATDT